MYSKTPTAHGTSRTVRRAGWPLLLAVALLGTGACEAVSPQRTPEMELQSYWKAVRRDVCNPDSFYTQCIWSSQAGCQEDLDMYLEVCVRAIKRLPKSGIYKDEDLMLPEEEQTCMFDWHMMFHGITPLHLPTCYDASLWPRVPASSQAKLDERREHWRQYEARKKAAQATAPIP